jgi:hypothetical protein
MIRQIEIGLKIKFRQQNKILLINFLSFKNLQILDRYLQLEKKCCLTVALDTCYMQ